MEGRLAFAPTFAATTPAARKKKRSTTTPVRDPAKDKDKAVADVEELVEEAPLAVDKAMDKGRPRSVVVEFRRIFRVV